MKRFQALQRAHTLLQEEHALYFQATQHVLASVGIRLTQEEYIQLFLVQGRGLGIWRRNTVSLPSTSTSCATNAMLSTAICSRRHLVSPLTLWEYSTRCTESM